MEVLEILILETLIYFFIKAKIPLFTAIDSAILKFFAICLENKDFLIWLCKFEWRMIKGVAKVLLFISSLIFIYWVISKILILYLSETHEEYQSKDFKNFQKIRRKRWITIFVFFFLLNPSVLTGQSSIVAPFNHLIFWILDPFFIEGEYFLKDGYYDDYLYINIPYIYDKDLKMITYFVKLQDQFYIQTFSYVMMFFFFILVFRVYFDWIILFDNFVYKNIRKTGTFNELLNDYKYWKEVIIKASILIFPYSKIIFLYIKKIIDHQELRILDDDEYDEFYKKNLGFYYKKQVLVTNLMIITENYIRTLFNLPKKETF